MFQVIEQKKWTGYWLATTHGVFENGGTIEGHTKNSMVYLL